MNTIVGDPPTIYKWICRTKNIEQQFYPLKDIQKEKKKIIDQFLDWIQLIFKRCEKRLTKMMFQKALIKKGIITKEDCQFSEAEDEKEKKIFY